MQTSRRGCELITYELPILHIDTLEIALDRIKGCFLVISYRVETFEVAFSFIRVVWAFHHGKRNFMLSAVLCPGLHEGVNFKAGCQGIRRLHSKRDFEAIRRRIVCILG